MLGLDDGFEDLLFADFENGLLDLIQRKIFRDRQNKAYVLAI